MAGPDLIFKVADRPLVEQAQTIGVFKGSPVDLADGFIHFSTAAQLRDTLRLHFSGQGDLILLAIPVAALPDLRWEPSRGGQLFPHLYAPLAMRNVSKVAPIAVSGEGSADLPDWVQ